MNDIARIAGPLVLVASEADKAAMRAAGVRHATLIDPRVGGEQVLRGDALRSELAVFAKFVLALPPGCEMLRDDIAIRLGDHRCAHATWRPDADAEAVLAAAVPMWADEISTLSVIPEPAAEQTFKTGFDALDEHGLRLVLPGLVVVLGPYGSGKSVFLRQLAANLWRLHKWRVLITALEERVKPRIRRDLRRHLIGRPSDTWREIDIAHADSEIESGFVFLRRPRRDLLDADRLIARIEFGVRVYGVRAVVIDPFNEVDFIVPKGENKTDHIARVIMSLKALADDYGLLMIVAHHPPKLAADRRVRRGLLTLGDAADSAHFGNKSDLGLCLWRNVEGPTFLHIDKVKDHETMGKPTLAELRLDSVMARFEVARMGYQIAAELEA